MFKYLLIILLILILQSCANSRNSVLDTYPSGNLHVSYYTDAQDLKHGLYIQYYDTPNVIKNKFIFAHGLLDGEFSTYYQNGKLKYRGQFHNDALSNSFVFYDSTGFKKQELTLSNGILEGSFKEFHPSGIDKILGSYKDNKKDNYWKYFDENGGIIAEGDYLLGDKKGTWKYLEKGMSLEVCWESYSDRNLSCIKPSGMNIYADTLMSDYFGFGTGLDLQTNFNMSTEKSKLSDFDSIATSWSMVPQKYNAELINFKKDLDNNLEPSWHFMFKKENILIHQFYYFINNESTLVSFFYPLEKEIRGRLIMINIFNSIRNFGQEEQLTFMLNTVEQNIKGAKN